MRQVCSCWRVCSRGLYSCYWRESSSSQRKMSCCWLSFVTVVSLLSLCWLYICLITFNDQEELNGQLFKWLNRWFNWFMVIIIFSAVLTSYCVLLLLFALIQIVFGEKLDLHWLHKIFLFLGVIIIIGGISGIVGMWKRELPTISLSLQATAPFLQFGAVAALTLISSFVFQAFHKIKKNSRFLVLVLFAAVAAAIFLSPLSIHSPCFIELKDLPEKPKLFAHRGAPMLAPENTMMAFERSVACGVTAFETDVQLSKDRIPFLMHDSENEFLLRTTNVKNKLPQRAIKSNMDLTFEEIQNLNAGEWFLKTDPFRSVSQLSEEEKQTARNQTVPSLLQLLELAKQHNISVIFDLYRTHKDRNDREDTAAIIDTIRKSNINPGLILWLPPSEREWVNKTSPGFVHIYSNESEMRKNNGRHLNVRYTHLSMNRIRELRADNITVNLWVVNERWLFSLLWCAGASSVTTNSCHLLKDVEQPDWFMSYQTYTIIWIVVDVVSVLIMAALFFCQWKTHCSRLREGAMAEVRTEAASWMRLAPVKMTPAYI
ncbi:glycerophosphoinositol inositolphosphodiesterase GDPD2 isoform X2 [Oryzias melastigma]|uniref:glycerophosphoinositol inositolphosphodiesterase GDPD2 isoform X2 n=1 Tax=Oryzias melastigma TaxID=30732 RepID=UPI000CF7CC3B|nr:glycerophosphoinositol inositolphosphodiesterase GDPD2 isoform X2 [Oryzias melastigma]